MNWGRSVHSDPQYQVDDPLENQDKKKDSKFGESKLEVVGIFTNSGAILISLVFGFVVFKAVPEMIGEGGKMWVMGKGNIVSACLD